MADDDLDDYYLFKAALFEVNKSVKLTYFSSCDVLLDYLKESINLPNLIVLDINMPGTNGYNCLAAIKNDGRLADIPVIFYSTSSEPVMIQKAYDDGAYQYVVKPYSMELLKKYIEELLLAPSNGPGISVPGKKDRDKL